MAEQEKVQKTEQEWREQLTQEEFIILRQKGTERPFTGKYVNEKRKGVYQCAGCGNALFSSDTKYDSRSGWPSFYDVMDEGNVELIEDQSHGMRRVEVVCAACGGHLGHVFPDGPADKTGLRYCINSVSITLDQDAE
jgi:peptide-methionine (R)-S-oxide reductase